MDHIVKKGSQPENSSEYFALLDRLIRDNDLRTIRIKYPKDMLSGFDKMAEMNILTAQFGLMCNTAES
jgi:hypothetical protein